MTDARWLDVEDDFTSASRHFANAVLLFEANGFAGDDLDAERVRPTIDAASRLARALNPLAAYFRTVF